jgi:hypothetical protein
VTQKFSNESQRNCDRIVASLHVDLRSSRLLSSLEATTPHPLSRLAGHRSQTSPVTMSRAAEAAIAASYKSLKEDFVSNLTGGEIGEINYVTAVAPASFSFPSAGLF